MQAILKKRLVQSVTAEAVRILRVVRARTVLQVAVRNHRRAQVAHLRAGLVVARLDARVVASDAGVNSSHISVARMHARARHFAASF